MSTSKDRQELLNNLVANNRELELDDVWHKYVALCKRTSTPIKLFLEDIILYGNKKITVGAIRGAIQDAISDIKKGGVRSEDGEEKAAKRPKIETANADSLGVKCKKCKGKNIISITSRACDKNYVTLPWGREIEGYAPIILGVTDGDGARFDLCVDCGSIVGFDPKAVKAEMKRLRRDYPPDENSNSENSNSEDVNSDKAI